MLLKGGHVIDPANNIDGIRDVAIAGGKIARVAADIPASETRRAVDVQRLYVTPGLIDLHTHVYLKGRASTVVADDVLPHGTTTIVDAGVSGWKNFDDFKATIIDRAQVRILALLNIVGSGMNDDQSKENNVADMDPRATAAKISQYPSILVGVKTAHFSLPGWAAVEHAIEAGRIANKPVMLDSSIYSNSGRNTRDKVLKQMRPGDIHTHMFNDHQLELLNRFTGKVQPWMWEARKRGVLFDVGHGAGGFLWPVAQAAISQGFLPDTIGTDLHPGSIVMLQASVPNTISKLMNLGMSLQDGILRATVNPAKAIGRYPELATLSAGAIADVAVLELDSGVFSFIDSMKKKLTGTKKLECVMTLRDGKVLFDRDGRMVQASSDTARLAPLPTYSREESRAEEGSTIYDLVLKQGRVIDPGNKRYGRYDIAINRNKIVKIAKWLPLAHARLAVDASEYYVTPGLIDVNANVNFIDSTSGVQPDQHSLPYGVTTLADPKATQAVIRRSRTQVLPVGVQTRINGLISSGMNRQNVLAEQASMTRALSLRLNEGVPLTEVVEGATVRPARAIGREDLGVLREGAAADIAMFEIQQGDFALVDQNHRRLSAKAKIVCVMTIRNGDVVWDVHGLSIREWTQAGRYTSYR
ncbi:MAG: amidohydrolase/deacetylase family metallohydrolase [Acidobacteriia bacterium]|nr:amidohydrolase/deacetylase family metallohydrolase [Terriglobia bacterium]